MYDCVPNELCSKNSSGFQDESYVKMSKIFKGSHFIWKIL